MTKAYEWLDKADQDIAIAELALEQRIPLLDNAAYNVQQAAEKTIKAILQHIGEKIPKTHDIAQIIGKLPIDHHLIEEAQSLTPTTPWVIQSRYPDFEVMPPIMPGRQTLQDMIGKIRDLQDKVVEDLPKLKSTLAISLKPKTSVGQRRTVAGLYTTAKILTDTLNDDLVDRSPESDALRSLLLSCRQEEYKKIKDKWEPTGRTFTDRAGAEYLRSKQNPYPCITFSKFYTDEIILQSPQHSPGYERLTEIHTRILKGRSDPGQTKNHPTPGK